MVFVSKVLNIKVWDIVRYRKLLLEEVRVVVLVLTMENPAPAHSK